MSHAALPRLTVQGFLSWSVDLPEGLRGGARAEAGRLAMALVTDGAVIVDPPGLTLPVAALFEGP